MYLRVVGVKGSTNGVDSPNFRVAGAKGTTNGVDSPNFVHVHKGGTGYFTTHL